VNDELARVRERLAQLRAGLRADLQARLTPAAAPAGARAVTFAPGDRVFDLRTGQEGVVEHAYRENIVRPTAGR
jgi:hypothetical protein